MLVKLFCDMWICIDYRVNILKVSILIRHNNAAIANKDFYDKISNFYTLVFGIWGNLAQL